MHGKQKCTAEGTRRWKEHTQLINHCRCHWTFRSAFILPKLWEKTWDTSLMPKDNLCSPWRDRLESSNLIRQFNRPQCLLELSTPFCPALKCKVLYCQTAQILSRQPTPLAPEASYQNVPETDNCKICRGKLSGAGTPGSAHRQVVTMALQERYVLPPWLFHTSSIAGLIVHDWYQNSCTEGLPI